MKHRINYFSKEQWKGKELPTGYTLKKLYDEQWKDSCAWGMVEKEKLVAVIETCPEIETNYLRIIELWVDIQYRNCGWGHELMEVVKEQARLERRKGIVVVPQSCNVNAIEFYRDEGFAFLSRNSDNQISKEEFHLQLCWMPEQKPKLNQDEIVMRKKTELDYYAVEEMVKKLFETSIKRAAMNICFYINFEKQKNIFRSLVVL